MSGEEKKKRGAAGYASSPPSLGRFLLRRLCRAFLCDAHGADEESSGGFSEATVARSCAVCLAAVGYSSTGARCGQRCCGHPRARSFQPGVPRTIVNAYCVSGRRRTPLGAELGWLWWWRRAGRGALVETAQSGAGRPQRPQWRQRHAKEQAVQTGGAGARGCTRGGELAERGRGAPVAAPVPSSQRPAVRERGGVPPPGLDARLAFNSRRQNQPHDCVGAVLSGESSSLLVAVSRSCVLACCAERRGV